MTLIMSRLRGCHAILKEFFVTQKKEQPTYVIYSRFVPHKPGRYTVDVRCGGQSIENSPFVMKISEAETVSVKLKEFEKQVTRWFVISHPVLLYLVI